MRGKFGGGCGRVAGWGWLLWLVWRRTEARAAVLAVADVLTTGVTDHGSHGPRAWLPDPASVQDKSLLGAALSE